MSQIGRQGSSTDTDDKQSSISKRHGEPRVAITHDVFHLFADQEGHHRPGH
jgi:hypothetical protein